MGERAYDDEEGDSLPSHSQIRRSTKLQPDLPICERGN
jgi:hypothetical protein